MPSSNYSGFDVLIDNDDGTTTPVPSQTVTVYNITGAAALSSVASDSVGHVASGTLPVAAGTQVRFSVALANGQNGYAETVTS